jgi:hypothetical protein
VNKNDKTPLSVSLSSLLRSRIKLNFDLSKYEFSPRSNVYARDDGGRERGSRNSSSVLILKTYTATYCKATRSAQNIFLLFAAHLDNIFGR